MSGRNSQISRIYALLNLLEGAQGLTIAELTQRLDERGHDASQRTVRRDVEALAAAGFPVVESDRSANTNATRWGLESRTRISGHLILNSRELMALFLARGTLQPLSETPFYADLTNIFTKLESHLGQQGKSYLDELAKELKFEPGPRWGLGVDPDLLDTVQACCAERQVLSTTYESASSGTKRTRRLGPQFLYFAKGSLYLIAEDLETREPKVFSVARMANAKMMDEAYEGDEIDPDVFFKSSFGVFQGKGPVHIKIEIASTIAPYVKERRWHASQKVVSKDDNSIILSLDAALTPDLIQWILGFGADAKVIEPNDLKQKLAEAAAGVVKLYSRTAA